LNSIKMLSIIIPTLNEEDCLPLLLESIKKQDFLHYEIIVADAGSEDKTNEIAKKYGCKVVSGGLPAKGRNQGAKIAQGDLFLFIDADIILPEKFLGEILNEFQKNNLSVAACLLGLRNRNRFLEFLFNFFYNWPILVLEKILPHASHLILVKKEIHNKLGGFDEEIKLGEDHIYVREKAKIGKFGILKSAQILITLRRFKKEGFVRTYLKYVLAEFHLVFLGPIKSDIFKYRFNHYCQNTKNKS